MACRAEFMIEPFVEGDPGLHVTGAIDAARAHGFEPEIGPFGTAIVGDTEDVLSTVGAVLAASREAGASRVSLQIDFAA